MTEEAQRWLGNAQRDMQRARSIFAPQDWAGTAFYCHCQQTVEKWLKALLASKNENAWGHELTKLMERVAEVYGESLPTSFQRAARETRARLHRSPLSGCVGERDSVRALHKGDGRGENFMGGGSRRIRSIEALPRYREELREFCRRVVERYQPACIILHGSFARGDWHEHSDLDLVVISDNLPADYWQRVRAMGELRPPGAPVSVFCYTVADWERGLSRAHGTPCEAMEFGFPLHGQQYWRKMRRRFLAMNREGLERTEVSWRLPPHLAARL